MYIVFDIGGTNTRVAASIDGKTIGEAVIYPTPQDFLEGIEKLTETAKQLANKTPIIGIAGGVPGPMDTEHTQLLKAPNIKNWNGKPLKLELETRLHAPVRLENDTATWALGEAYAGEANANDIVVYMTISTGVGGTRIVHGNIDASAYGFEIGHQVINPAGPVCGCGGRGHLEAYIGGSSIQKQYGKAPQEITDSKVWESIADYLAIGLINISVFWSPHRIILGGSMMKSIPMERVLASVESLNTILPTLPEIQRSTLGETGGLIGALHLLKK